MTLVVTLLWHRQEALHVFQHHVQSILSRDTYALIIDVPARPHEKNEHRQAELIRIHARPLVSVTCMF